VQHIMTEMKVRSLPMFKDGVIHGVITLGDIADHNYQEEEIGGKAGFLKGVVGRLDLPTGTKVAQTASSQDPPGERDGEGRGGE
jgi:hypothetical protein